MPAESSDMSWMGLPRPRPQLVPLRHVLDGSSRRLPWSGATVGRRQSCTICVDHPSVSGLHCRIVPVHGGRWHILNKGVNGTYVNGGPIGSEASWPLRDGDVSKLGQGKRGLREAPTYRFEVVRPLSRRCARKTCGAGASGLATATSLGVQT